MSVGKVVSLAHHRASDQSDRDLAADRSKAGFKFDLFETVNADPRAKPADLAMIVAYAGKMSWPKRTAWLSTAHARALTGLSERQVNISRARLRKIGYLTEPGMKGTARLFTIANPNRDRMRDHVTETTAFHRERTKDRQAARRAHRRAVTANSDATEPDLSHSPSDCDVAALFAGNTPQYPSVMALEEEGISKGYSEAKGDDPFRPFPKPQSDREADEMLSAITEGMDPSPAVLAFYRLALIEGRLTPDHVRQYREART